MAEVLAGVWAVAAGAVWEVTAAVLGRLGERKTNPATMRLNGSS